jgi:RNA polymerase sigma factor FliA
LTTRWTDWLDANFEDGDEDELTRLVKEYMPLVRHAVNRIVAGQMHSSILQYEDMVSCGVQGLLEAYKAYDRLRGAKFATYALPRIRGSILDAFRAANPLPRSLQRASSNIDRAISALYGDLGRTPSMAEIAERLELPLDELITISQATSIRVLSLESLAEVAVSGSIEKLTGIADDDSTVDPETVAERKHLRARLLQAIDALPERERQIIRLYYLESQALKNIGTALSISESRASQLRHRAIRRLRVALVQEFFAEAA